MADCISHGGESGAGCNIFTKQYITVYLNDLTLDNESDCICHVGESEASCNIFTKQYITVYLNELTLDNESETVTMVTEQWLLGRRRRVWWVRESDLTEYHSIRITLWSKHSTMGRAAHPTPLNRLITLYPAWKLHKRQLGLLTFARQRLDKHDNQQEAQSRFEPCTSWLGDYMRT